MFTWANLLSGLVSLFNKIAVLVHDKQIADGAVAKEVLKDMEKEREKVDAAISAGNDSKRVHINDDPQDRANKRKKASL